MQEAHRRHWRRLAALVLVLAIGLLWALLTDNPCADALSSCFVDTQGAQP